MRSLVLFISALLLCASAATARTIMVIPPDNEQTIEQPADEAEFDWEAVAVEMDAEDKAWAIACPEGYALINAMEAADKREQAEMTPEERSAAAMLDLDAIAADMEAAADEAMAMMDNCTEDDAECAALMAPGPFCPEAE